MCMCRAGTAKGLSSDVEGFPSLGTVQSTKYLRYMYLTLSGLTDDDDDDDDDDDGGG